MMLTNKGSRSAVRRRLLECARGRLDAAWAIREWRKDDPTMSLDTMRHLIKEERRFAKELRAAARCIAMK